MEITAQNLLESAADALDGVRRAGKELDAWIIPQTLVMRLHFELVRPGGSVNLGGQSAMKLFGIEVTMAYFAEACWALAGEMAAEGKIVAVAGEDGFEVLAPGMDDWPGLVLRKVRAGTFATIE